ncbi:DUF1989 domain-containing protein [Phreatobacter stygius]|uniref:Urea carboxylase-associated family protein n=1 Tax=Phreatobacter stygius TaxID=1940610 RepID=A0A4D7BDJ2_9HYPH|nr:urea carboxylase-associated family protein [Phreatobacter stygius]QCI66052.1 urea carboxylase-associated family protein [Phreatobacter stygius]
MDGNLKSSDPLSITIAPYSGRPIRVSSGDFIRITDRQGQQVSDLWAFVVGDTLDWLSTSQTRDINESLFPAVGQSFYSDKGRPLLTLVEDGSPGPHDMLFPACNSALFERVGRPGHPNCRDNLLLAMQEEGISLPFVPDPVDFFQNSLPSADGRLNVFASINPPGGFVVLRTECDLLLVVTACSVDFHPTNGDRCTEIDVTVSPSHGHR